MKTFLNALVLGVVLISAGSAVAGDSVHDRKAHRGYASDAGFGLPAVQRLTRAFRHLDLGEDQKEAIRANLQAMREQVRPLVKQFHQSRKELHGLIRADEYDAEAAAALATEQGNLTAEITIAVSGTAAGLLALLTEEQRAELEALGERHRAQRDQLRDRRTDRPGKDRPGKD